MARRLTEHHPAFKAVQELFAYMDEKEISLTANGYGEATVTVGKETFKLKDLENNTYPMETFPPMLEYKLLTNEE